MQEQKVDDSLSAKKAAELMAEIKNLKEMVSKSQEEMKTRDDDIESLKTELHRVKQFESKLAEKDEILAKSKEETSKMRIAEAHASQLVNSSRTKIQELEDEVQKASVSEAKMLESLASQTKQLEQIKMELEESKVSANPERNPVVIERVKDDDSVKKLRDELQMAMEAEENSKKAMDELALALKEVATESHQTKEKLGVAELELEHARGEAQQLKVMVRNTEERYEKLLEEAKKEAEMCRNTAERLRVEAEESLFAWNGKEMGFVSCIKKAEEERAVVQHENARLIGSLKAAEFKIRAAKEENFKLRDILKQAINEANAAKAAAGIARDENSCLKDGLAEKEEALHFLTKENEKLRISEAAAKENAKEFKKLLASAASTEHSEIDGILRSYNDEDYKKLEKQNFSFNLDELKFLHYDEDSSDRIRSHEDDPEKEETLKGSIFDTTYSPTSEPVTPKPVVRHDRVSSLVFTEDGDIAISEYLDNPESTNFDELESERNHRRRKTMFSRVGDLILWRSFHKREASPEVKLTDQ